jgi:TolB protein
MQKFLRVFLCFGTVFATSLSFAQGPKNIGTIEVKSDVLSVHVSGTGELNNLAILAFSKHGRYQLVSSGGTYDIRFSSVSPNQVRVDVLKNGASVLSQTATGSSTRNALFRAADLAVKATTGLPGFFASKLAFVSNKSGKEEIFVSDLFLGEARQITHDNAHALTPRWSPDGNKLLYTSYYKSGFPDIFLIDLSSLQRTTFVSFQGTNSGARFSPNGQQVAMVLSGEGNPEIYVSNAQGRQVSRRTRTDAVEASPCFSPDGSRILYTSDSAGRPQLYVMPASGGSAQRLSTGYIYSAEPDWCRANPNLIAFTAGIGRGYQVGVYDLSGRNPVKIVSNEAGDAIEPVWLADGRHLIYTSRSPNSRSLYILDTETKRSFKISAVSAEKASVWGP